MAEADVEAQLLGRVLVRDEVSERVNVEAHRPERVERIRIGETEVEASLNLSAEYCAESETFWPRPKRLISEIVPVKKNFWMLP